MKREWNKKQFGGEEAVHRDSVSRWCNEAVELWDQGIDRRLVRSCIQYDMHIHSEKLTMMQHDVRDACTLHVSSVVQDPPEQH